MKWLPTSLEKRLRRVRSRIRRLPLFSTKSRGPFRQDWYADEQLEELTRVCELVRDLAGSVVEIGCWEGKSTIALANACYPETLAAVDHWRGNLEEGQDHESIRVLKETDVFAAFQRNVREMTRQNVRICKTDAFDFLSDFEKPIKFCHIDASHDYRSVRRTIEMLLPRLVPGAILCGDDYLSAHRGREDLEGGVERAVSELLEGHEHVRNFWYWQYTPRGQ